MRQDAAFLDDLVQRQHEIAGNAEDLARAVILQALQQGGRERGHWTFTPSFRGGTKRRTRNPEPRAPNTAFLDSGFVRWRVRPGMTSLLLQEGLSDEMTRQYEERDDADHTQRQVPPGSQNSGSEPRAD